MTLKLAFIGCGGIARRHVVAMKDLSNRGRTGFTITAVCDTHEPNAQLLAKNLAEQLDMHPTVYTDYQELLKKEQLDGVDICLPHGLHHSVAIDCMEAGLHVLCEKPLGVTIKACRAMAETADRTGKILSTAVPCENCQPAQTLAWCAGNHPARRASHDRDIGASCGCPRPSPQCPRDGDKRYKTHEVRHSCHASAQPGRRPHRPQHNCQGNGVDRVTQHIATCGETLSAFRGLTAPGPYTNSPEWWRRLLNWSQS